ncbi:MAG: SemiSWEET transporter [Ignavibacteria bacterium]|jgi:MtN3 and saliva related transmembrane protein|nr:SemiSWEET transporter [Ignavibacteria bacterium]MBK6420566.1 SemiSWEET transporter [Ignavibacteria bacterium]MBK6761476.1 SemiSWEET transporter [Ignavibacteria bacterium]MBK7033500.1 SemiSWEET transporter [Ignavibacteria bacterium]MBK7186280.1 SemiSWEET transporter [Ignavibacteria bacterium]
MDPVTILGLTAGCCSTFALAPQAFKVWQTQQVDQLSIGMLGLMITGSMLWLSYGLLRSDVSIVWANAVAFLFIIYMLTKKIADMRQTGRR